MQNYAQKSLTTTTTANFESKVLYNRTKTTQEKKRSRDRQKKIMSLVWSRTKQERSNFPRKLYDHNKCNSRKQQFYLTHRDACKVQDFVIGGSVLFYNASINSEMKISVIRIFIRCVMRVGRNRINHSSLICFVISPMKIESMMYHLGMIEIIAHSGVSELRMKQSCRFCNHLPNSSVEILDVDNYFYRLTDSARSKIQKIMIAKILARKREDQCMM